MLPSSEETQLGSKPLIAGPPVKTLSGNLRRGPWGGDHHWGWTSEALDIEPKSNQLWRSFALKEGSRETAPEQHPWLPNTGWDNPELSGHGAPPVKGLLRRYFLQTDSDPDGFWEPAPLPALAPGPICLSQVHWTFFSFVASHKVSEGALPAIVPPHPFCFRQRRSRSSILTSFTPSLFQTPQERHVSSFSLREATLKGETCYCRESFCCANQLGGILLPVHLHHNMSSSQVETVKLKLVELGYCGQL